MNDILRKKEKIYLNDGDRIKFGGSPVVYTYNHLFLLNFNSFYIKSQSRNDPPPRSDPRGGGGGADYKEEKQEKRRNNPSKLPPQRNYSNSVYIYIYLL